MQHTGTYYLKSGFDRPALISSATEYLRDVDFDTIVATGVSGLIAAPVLAHVMDKHLLVVRKKGDGSHSSHRLEGRYGSRALLVDDFMDTGATVDRVLDALFHGPVGLKFAGAYMYRALSEGYLHNPAVSKFGRFYSPEFFKDANFLRESSQAYILRSL